MPSQVEMQRRSLRFDLAWRVRLLWRGRPVIVVSGLPRSGTSMVMQMLAAGGLDIVTDGVRGCDEDNPRGYFEDERVKQLEHGVDTAWLADCRGRAIKIVSPLLRGLPRRLNYRVIFVERDLDEVLQSQRTMLLRRQEGAADHDDVTLQRAFERHLGQLRRFLRTARHARTLHLSHREVLADPLRAAHDINSFLGGALDERAMAAAVEPSLHRKRSGES